MSQDNTNHQEYTVNELFLHVQNMWELIQNHIDNKALSLLRHGNALKLSNFLKIFRRYKNNTHDDDYEEVIPNSEESE